MVTYVKRLYRIEGVEALCRLKAFTSYTTNFYYYKYTFKGIFETAKEIPILWSLNIHTHSVYFMTLTHVRLFI